MQNKIERLSNALLKGDKKSAAIIYSSTNRRYFTELLSSAGFVIVTAEESYLIVDFRYIEVATNNAKGVTVEMFSNADEKIKEILKKHNIENVYMETAALPYAQAKKFETACEAVGAKAIFDDSLDNVIKDIRIIKTADEVEKIKASQSLTDAAYEHILPFIKEGAVERDIALEIEFFMRKNGADGVAFSLIIVAGENSSMCHGVPGKNKIKKGDFITMDTGALLDGYHSDMTRTVALGHVSDEQRDVYETVLKAHNEAMYAIKPGAICSDVDKVARDIIDAKYAGTFGHGLGHGVGFDIHEWPRLSAMDNTVLEEGMVVTDEPGIYLPGKFGVRIEDMVLVTKDGYESLTNSPKELVIL